MVVNGITGMFQKSFYSPFSGAYLLWHKELACSVHYITHTLLSIHLAESERVGCMNALVTFLEKM